MMSNKDHIYKDQMQSVTVTVGMVYTDPRGHDLAEPFMGVKMDGSDWYPVKRVNEMALEFAERKLAEEVQS